MINLRGVSKTVSSGGRPLTILHPLDLHVQAGQRLAIVGPSGSGKSTLIGLMAGLDQPSSGEILIDGTDITKLGEDALARLRGRAIGFVFQQFNLIPTLTALENVEVGLAPTGVGRHELRHRSFALLGEVGLSDRAQHLPAQLSGGEQQRVAIARALVAEAPLVLADEPTSQLDSVNSEAVAAILRDLVDTRGLTAVVTTHDPIVVAAADRTIELDDGRVVSG